MVAWQHLYKYFLLHILFIHIYYYILPIYINIHIWLEQLLLNFFYCNKFLSVWWQNKFPLILSSVCWTYMNSGCFLPYTVVYFSLQNNSEGLFSQDRSSNTTPPHFRDSHLWHCWHFWVKEFFVWGLSCALQNVWHHPYFLPSQLWLTKCPLGSKITPNSEPLNLSQILTTEYSKIYF